MPGLSAQALATAGVTPGSAVKAGGLSFTWPAPAAGAADNVVAGGQAILAGGSGTTLGFLVTGTYGTATGTGTILYSDGTSQSFTLSAPDWYAGPPAGSDVAITMPYRNAPGNAQDRHPVQVYYVGVPLAQGTTVQAVILPNVSASPPSAGSPALHVFAMAIGRPRHPSPPAGLGCGRGGVRERTAAGRAGPFPPSGRHPDVAGRTRARNTELA